MDYSHRVQYGFHLHRSSASCHAAQTFLEHLHSVQLLVDRSDALHFDDIGCAISKALGIIFMLESLHASLLTPFAFM